MRFSYDDDADIAYLRLFDLPEHAGGASDSVAVESPASRGGIVLDFNLEGHLVGIEVMNARAQLPPEAFDA